ncbi:MAG: phytase [Xanthomonadales bacterium]|nr:phytase [Xanthomonadales bacterium]
MPNLLHRTACLLACAALAACASAPRQQAREPDEAEDVTTVQAGVRYALVGERFLTASTPRDNIDSPASWRAPDGKTWLIATAKGTHGIVVYDGDSGETLRRVIDKGNGAGEFRRPNGVFVIDDVVFVVERDNRRVQALSLPDLRSLGSFGEDQLRKPYGLWLQRDGDGYDVLVSDAYMRDDHDDLPPPDEQLDQRYKRYRVGIEAGALRAKFLGHVGSVEAAGAIRIPESLWADPMHDVLLLAEEDQADGTRIKVYDLDGNYRGRDLGRGLFRAQAEGIALWQCADGSGYWIATDQFKDRSVFHVFDRVGLEHLGAFAGRTVANTDGVWLQQAATAAFPHGVFYAVHDDQGVGAFDWDDIAQALGLRHACAD